MPAKFTGDWSSSRAPAAGRELVACLTSAMKQATEFGADVARDVVETSGTGYQGRRGRVDTGIMVGAIDADSSESAGIIEGRFGWLKGTPYYLIFQEYGFRHYITGELIEGMRALREADDQAWDEFVVSSDKCIERYKQNAL